MDRVNTMCPLHHSSKGGDIKSRRIVIWGTLRHSSWSALPIFHMVIRGGSHFWTRFPRISNMCLMGDKCAHRRPQHCANIPPWHPELDELERYQLIILIDESVAMTPSKGFNVKSQNVVTIILSCNPVLAHMLVCFSTHGDSTPYHSRLCIGHAQL